jgi:hypothetical protein
VTTDDLHAPLGLERPAVGRPIVHSVAAAVLGFVTAAVVIGAAAWYGPLTRSPPTPAPPQVVTPAVTKPAPAVVVNAPAAPRVQAPGTSQTPARPPPQITGSTPPAAPLEGANASPQDQPAAPGSTDRIITIIDGRSGARQEVRIPVTPEVAHAAPPDPGLTDPMLGFPSADEAPDIPSPPSRTKPNAPQKRAKPGQAISTNSALPVPLR